MNALDMSLAAIPPCWLFVAGFSCTSISSYNCHAKDNRSCVASGAGSTGKTWKGCVTYLERWAPSWALFENLSLLSATDASGSESNLSTCLSDLAKVGYRAASFTLCPSSLGLPKERERLFILASKRSPPRPWQKWSRSSIRSRRRTQSARWIPSF